MDTVTLFWIKSVSPDSFELSAAAAWNMDNSTQLDLKKKKKTPQIQKSSCLSHFLPPQSFWWAITTLLKFFSPHFSLPAQEPEAKPQNLTEDIEKKKQKKPKKTSNIHNAITGFEEAFEQFATSGIKTSKKAVVNHPEVGNPLTARQSDIPADNKLDVSAQVRFFCSKSIRFVFWVVTSRLI